MQYIGGKQKSGGHRIAAAVLAMAARVGAERVIEKCCGTLSVTQRLQGERWVSDACVPLISLYTEMLRGWEPPTVVPRETWEAYRPRPGFVPDPLDPMTAFVGFGCSRSGAWFSSFIVDYKYTKRRVPAAVAARDSLRKKLARCVDVHFAAHGYEDGRTDGVVYCDIPYEGTLGYPAVGTFDHPRFWTWFEETSKTTPVIVSEAKEATHPIAVLDEWSVQRRLNTPTATRRMERLLVHERWAS